MVIYDAYGIMSAPRVWWLLTEFGHKRASVLDGGLPKWLSEGRPVESGEPNNIVPTTYIVDTSVKPTAVLFDELKTSYTKPRSEQLLIDGRPAGRFHGTVLEPRPFLPSGHIPGSVSVPALELVKDGVALPDEEIKKRFEDVGVEFGRGSKQSLVNTCGSGVAASATFLFLLKLGVEKDRLRWVFLLLVERIFCWFRLLTDLIKPHIQTLRRLMDGMVLERSAR